MDKIFVYLFVLMVLLFLFFGTAFAALRLCLYWFEGLIARERRSRTVLQILAVPVIAIPTLYLIGDVFKGRMLGTFALTTTDPREFWGSFETSTGREPVTVQFPDPERMQYPTVMPLQYLAIPRVYINGTSPMNSGHGIFSIGLKVITTTFEPYRTGIQKIIAERKAAGLPGGLRNGEVSKALNIGLQTDPTLTADERQKELRRLVLSENNSDEVCTQKPGPFPNSIEYRPRNNFSKSSTACLSIRDGEGFFAILVYRDGNIESSIICREVPTLCFATAYRRHWLYRITFSRPEVAKVPEYLRRTDELLSQFEVGSNLSAHGEAQF